MFSLFKKKKKQFLELTPEQDTFLASAIENHNNNAETLNNDWGFNDFEEWGFDQESHEFFLLFKDNSKVVARGQIYGSYSKDDKSWEWAWNNPMVEESVSRDSLKIKEYGEKESLEYLTQGAIPLPNLESAVYLASIGEKINNAQGIYPADAGAITVFIGLYDLKRI